MIDYHEGEIMPDQTALTGNRMTSQQILEIVNPLYVELPEGPIHVNCGDGRTSVDSNEPLYAKVFGGRLGLAWNYMVLKEMSQPGSVQSSLSDVDAELETSGKYAKAEIIGGVHSDEAAEGAGATDINIGKFSLKVGCGREARAAEIAATLLENIDDVIDELREIAPQVIAGREDDATSLAQVNAELANRKLQSGRPVLPAGREAVTAAINNGARGIVLAGEHVEDEAAAYNLVERTTNDNKSTQKHFGADGWVNSLFFKANQDSMPFDPNLVILQDAMVALATKQVLTGTMRGVAVRA